MATTEQVMKRYYERKGQHRCAECGIDFPVGYKQVRCRVCLDRDKPYDAKRRSKRKQQSRCSYCGFPIDPRAKVTFACESCWFKSVALKATGTFRNGEAIKRLFEAQKARCAYTGKLLIIGINASIDHIVPVSRGGNKSLDNIQWVDKEVNYLKKDFLPEEFVQILKDIYIYLFKQKEDD